MNIYRVIKDMRCPHVLIQGEYVYGSKNPNNGDYYIAKDNKAFDATSEHIRELTEHEMKDVVHLINKQI